MGINNIKNRSARRIFLVLCIFILPFFLIVYLISESGKFIKENIEEFIEVWNL